MTKNNDSLMDIRFLVRVQKASLVLGVLVFLFTAVYYDFRFALAFLVGNIWGVANFWALQRLMCAVVTPGAVDRSRAILLAAIKFPLLYIGGYLILRSDWFSPLALLAGFTSLFAVVFLKALGRAILHLDDRKSKPSTPLAHQQR